MICVVCPPVTSHGAEGRRRRVLMIMMKWFSCASPPGARWLSTAGLSSFQNLPSFLPMLPVYRTYSPSFSSTIPNCGPRLRERSSTKLREQCWHCSESCFFFLSPIPPSCPHYGGTFARGTLQLGRDGENFLECKQCSQNTMS